MTSKLVRFLSLSVEQKLFTTKVAIVLPLINLSLRLFSLKTVFEFLGARCEGKQRDRNCETSDIQSLARLVSDVARNHPAPGKCLCKSLTLWWCLSQAGIESDLRIGVRKEDGKLLGHAWVEFRGLPLVERDTTIERYNFYSHPVLKDWIWS